MAILTQTIQMKDSSGNLLFPRLRLIDITSLAADATTSTAVWTTTNGSCVIKSNYVTVPVITSTNATPSTTGLATTSLVKQYVSKKIASSGANGVAGVDHLEYGLGVYDANNRSSGAITLSARTATQSGYDAQTFGVLRVASNVELFYKHPDNPNYQSTAAVTIEQANTNVVIMNGFTDANNMTYGFGGNIAFGSNLYIGLAMTSVGGDTVTSTTCIKNVAHHLIWDRATSNMFCYRPANDGTMTSQGSPAYSRVTINPIGLGLKFTSAWHATGTNSVVNYVKWRGNGITSVLKDNGNGTYTQYINSGVSETSTWLKISKGYNGCVAFTSTAAGFGVTIKQPDGITTTSYGTVNTVADIAQISTYAGQDDVAYVPTVGLVSKVSSGILAAINPVMSTSIATSIYSNTFLPAVQSFALYETIS